MTSSWRLAGRRRRAVLQHLVSLGLPVAIALFFEVKLLAVVALIVSQLGIVDVAGHHIALNFSSLMFVLPLSLGVATTIRVGYRLGQGSAEQGVCMTITALFTVTDRPALQR